MTLPTTKLECLFTALTGFGNFGPELLNVLEHHVAMAIESLDSRQKLLVVSAIDQDLIPESKTAYAKRVCLLLEESISFTNKASGRPNLRVVFDALREDGERASIELLLLLLRQLLRCHFRSGFGRHFVF